MLDKIQEAFKNMKNNLWVENHFLILSGEKIDP